MIISISGLSATQVGCKENKDANVSLLMPLQGDVDVPAIQVQIISSSHARIRTRRSTSVMSKSAQGFLFHGSDFIAGKNKPDGLMS